jgi:hypothetical protein
VAARALEVSAGSIRFDTPTLVSEILRQFLAGDRTFKT